jgi:transmembrane sensor
MAWRSGEIEFRGEPLEDVIAELNRYAATSMVIEDDSLKGLRVSGLFKVAQAEHPFHAA